MSKNLVLSGLILFAPLNEGEVGTEPPTTEIGGGETTTPSTPSEGENENKTPTQEEIEKTITEKIKAYAEKYLNAEMVANVINWAINSGLIVALATIYLKYRKYKSMSSKEICEEVKKEVLIALGDEFKKLSEEQQAGILKAIDELCKEMENMKKALVISNDKTYEGKLAMLKLMEETTKETETKEQIKKVETQVKEEQKKDEQVKETVKKDYVPID